MDPIRLTETALTAATRRAHANGVRVEITDAACPGLRIRITPSGNRTWVLGRRDREGALRRFRLGLFPEMGISEARAAARTLAVEVDRGADPIAEARTRRQQARDARNGIGTLSAVLDRYAAQHGRNLRSWAEARRRIESVFAHHLDRPIGILRRADLQLTADAWPSQSSASAAVRYLRPVLKWAAARDLVAIDAANLKPPAPVGRRDRVLTRDELARMVPVLRGAESAYGPAMLFMLLTATRREETAGARWGDVGLETGVWTIHRTKNGQPHQVPLSRQALALLRERGPGKPSALVFGSSVAGAPLANWDRATKALLAAANRAAAPGGPVEHFTRHDLRRTAATLLGDMGELPDIIEAALNHTSIRSPLAATYNRSRYRPQVAAALQRLGDLIETFERGGAEVVPMRRA